MSITSDFEMAASAPDEALAKAVRDPMASPISQIAALSELRNRQQMRAEASAMQASQQPTVADQTLAPIGYARGGLVQAFADGSRGPVRQPRDIQIDPYYQKLVNDYIARAEKFESKGDPKARPIFEGEILSSASGRFQMLDDTRAGIDKRYGFDPRDRSAGTERKRMMVYTNDTINQLEAADIPVTGGTLYGGHLLGQRGVEKFMKAYAADPNMRAQDFFSPEVIRVNPGIFDSMRNRKLTTQTNKTLAEIMNKFDSVGIGKGKTPSRKEDSDIGAALQFANRVDTGDTGAGYRAGPGYEDANLALANMLAQNPDLIAPIGRGKQEAPEQQSFFYNPAPQGPSINPADEAEDMDVINQARERDRERMRRYKEQPAGSMPGFKDGGIVQHFRDGNLVIPLNMDPPGAVRRPDGTLILPMYPDRSAPGPGYDPLAYTGTLLGQPDMPPSPEPMTGMDFYRYLYNALPTAPTGDELQRRAESALQPFQPAVPAPSIGSNPFASTKGEAPMIGGLSNPFGLTGEPARIAREQQAAADRERYYTETLPERERAKLEAQLGKAPLSKADLDQTLSYPRSTPEVPPLLDPNYGRGYLEQTYRAANAGADIAAKRMEDIFGQENPYNERDFGRIPRYAFEVGKFGDWLIRGAIPRIGSNIAMGISGGLGDAFESSEAGAWSDQTGDKKVPIERGGKKTPAAPAPAPPQTKQRAGAGTNAGIAAGTDAGAGPVVTPTAPSGSGVGAGGAAGTKPIEASPYGPMEQFVRDLYARDEERRTRMTEREEEAKSMARLKAGLAIMGGKSPYFAQNLANALPVIQQYEQQMAGMAGDEDQFEQELRQRLIGARTGDIQMKAMQDRYNAEARAAEARSKVEIAELAQKGLLTMDSAFETHLKNLYGQPPEKPGPVADYATARQQALAMAAQDVRAMRENEVYRVNASGNAIKVPGVQ